MTMTGDWTVVGTEEPAAAESPPSPSPPPPSTMSSSSAVSSSSSSALMESTPTPQAGIRYPCIEQPSRFALRSSSNGLYLGGTRKGTLVGRAKRCEKDEWTIAFVTTATTSTSTTSAASSAAVTIRNHKFGGVLSLIDCKTSTMGRTVACVSQQGQKEHPKEIINNDLGLGEDEVNDTTNDNTTTTNDNDDNDDESPSNEQLPDDEDQDGDNDNDNESNMLLPTTTADQEDLQWIVVRCTGEDYPNGGVTIVSQKTGDSLGMTEQGTIVLTSSNDESSHRHVWEMECVTGELCYLSNPSLDARVRCDMAGILALSPNWKGWEVLRIIEASSPHSRNSNGGDDYGTVRISSWMHSQWFLCSDSIGNVSTCSVAESLMVPGTGGYNDDDTNNTNTTNNNNNTNNDNCSKWAIESYPSDDGSKHGGVIIRSVTHGRLLSIKDGMLRTYDSLEGFHDADDRSTMSALSAASTQGDLRTVEGVKQRTDALKRRGSQWWKQSLTNVQKSISDSAMHRRNSKLMAAGASPESRSMRDTASIPQEETIVWQLEAAHLQTYYFLSVPSNGEGETETETEEAVDEKAGAAMIPRSIGEFPSVTENLRKSDKIQILRSDDTDATTGTNTGTLKLYLPDEMFYIACSSKGSVFAHKQEDDEGTEWIQEEHPGGSVFRSKKHGLYLSLKDNDNDDNDDDEAVAAAVDEVPSSGPETPPGTPPASAFPGAVAATTGNDNDNANANDNDNDNNAAARPSPKGPAKPKNPFENLKLENLKLENLKLPLQRKKAPIAELCATTVPAFWKLEPCTPRAISSKRLKTFAIGASIAVGTTIAMPFALAGVAAALGALGAEAGIGFGIVAAGLTGAEALASVGAIGATAYFCFKPEDKSLGDGLEPSNDGRNATTTATPWSKRPFSNWRNW